ncbi:S-methyl-5-thioribose-1-phosphate isomerase [Candidatus Synechococcus calcipolaris G9]|uniref:Methylthioribose-1-phosphate isomerase n=1 Tax=Candidatus Synechococcus calcipolaris G9 TaxID=1497997 RepID=A0ABT6EZL7_9SYNE|nr:S-methyl-5-thioribose-1-phosphate isomerase [Candidatus Synechococcus calcipolaris]MDG2991012.1 S-methyl-5-thioribose-1-phosphate isomerase [Candidatus Synechococcus calcipolaris G9]
MDSIFPVIWFEDRVRLIDQTRLPNEYTFVDVRLSSDMAEAIRTMIVRGAPAIGVAAAFGIVLGSREYTGDQGDKTAFLAHLETVAAELRQTRPTAVNLFWAIAKMLEAAKGHSGSIPKIQEDLLKTAQSIATEDVETCRAIGGHGLRVLPPTPEKLRILTHCNAGALATAGYGTALGVIRSAWGSDRLERVYADETRPRMQGAKLTTWECVQEGIPVTLIADTMAAHCMQQGLIDAVVVGADRIARNGDTANKIGTYSVALAAQAHGIPFYVAAPVSTIDFKLGSGVEIPIEERNPQEIYQVGFSRICPAGVDFYNPAFDVTPAHLITGIITEHGAFSPGELASGLGEMNLIQD